MAEELSLKDQHMKGLTEKIQMMLDGLPKSKKQELDIAEIGSRLRDFQMTLDGAQLELKHLGAHSQKAEFTKLLRDHKHNLKQFKIDYEMAKKGSDKNALMDGAKPSATGADMTTADGMMAHGLKVQDQSNQSLARTLRVANEAKDIGIDVVAKLEADTAKIEGMADNLSSIDSTLARSRKNIARIARRMATDKVIWVLAFLVFAAIIAIIVYKNLKKSTGNDGSTNVPCLINCTPSTSTGGSG